MARINDNGVLARHRHDLGAGAVLLGLGELGEGFGIGLDEINDHAGGLAILLGIGLFGGLAQLAMTRSYRFGKTVVSAALSYSTVIFASLFGMVIWDETHPPSAWLAIALIIVSGLMVSFASRRRADD